MKKTLRLYGQLVMLSIHSQMQHRASFLMLFWSQAVSACADIFGIWVLFDRFRLIQGWNLYEVMVLYGIVHMGFSVGETLGRGFDVFWQSVKYGEFDRVLLRPLGTMVQVASSSIQLMRIGRFVQGGVVLLVGCSHLGVSFFSIQTLFLFFSFLGVSALFLGLLVIQGALSFWTTESLELMHIATYGGGEAGQYPLSIYTWPLKLFLTFIVPIGCVAYYPIASMLHHGELPFYFALFLPLVGVLFLLGASWVWKMGVRRYSSTGS